MRPHLSTHCDCKGKKGHQHLHPRPLGTSPSRLYLYPACSVVKNAQTHNRPEVGVLTARGPALKGVPLWVSDRVRSGQGAHRPAVHTPFDSTQVTSAKCFPSDPRTTHKASVDLFLEVAKCCPPFQSVHPRLNPTFNPDCGLQHEKKQKRVRALSGQSCSETVVREMGFPIG